MHSPLDRLPAAQRALLRPAGAGPPVPPMLATLSERRAFDERWLFERKLDGVRVLAASDADGTHLRSRTGRSIDSTYPEVVAALAAQEWPGLAVDGEVVALRGGRTDFELLQQRMGLTDPRAVRASPVAITYYLFDLLALDGWDTTRLPLRARKSLLRAAVAFHGPLRFTAHRNNGDLDEACAKGWEGLIAKRADAPYQPRRSRDWLKLKCSLGQEFVIGGFTRPAGSRAEFGALLLGYYDNGAGTGTGTGGTLRYAGKAGTGFTERTLRALGARLAELRRPTSPFTPAPADRTATWVEPRLVAQIAFTEWTRDGLLRHPRYLGLRDDKPPHGVTRERPGT
ncbi:non-homologous end-joining DNA ligase [Actinacidiphila rubida]|uniref:non-homologous end-joining DNA ligase n=1 Tax=Actinacidiphila rubida TaxID=310780 RepID=UPI00094551AD